MSLACSRIIPSTWGSPSPPPWHFLSDMNIFPWGLTLLKVNFPLVLSATCPQAGRCWNFFRRKHRDLNLRHSATAPGESTLTQISALANLSGILPSESVYQSRLGSQLTGHFLNANVARRERFQKIIPKAKEEKNRKDDCIVVKLKDFSFDNYPNACRIIPIHSTNSKTGEVTRTQLSERSTTASKTFSCGSPRSSVYYRDPKHLPTQILLR